MECPEHRPRRREMTSRWKTPPFLRAAVLCGPVITLMACHQVIQTRSVPPDMFVAATVAGGIVGIARADSVAACVRGRGELRLLPLEGHPDLAADPFLSLHCGNVRPLTTSELTIAVDEKGRRSGQAVPPELDGPIVDSHRGFIRIPGEWISTTYFLRYNDRYAQLVRWSHGNHWGTEMEHTYRVTDSDDGRRIETTRALERDVALD